MNAVEWKIFNGGAETGSRRQETHGGIVLQGRRSGGWEKLLKSDSESLREAAISSIVSVYLSESEIAYGSRK